MIAGGSQQVYAYAAPVDMRKGFNGLYALVKESLERDPLSGDLYLFVNRTRILAKVLMWDGTGLCVFAKRLERGRFAELWASSDLDCLELSRSELQLFLEGCRLVGRVKLSPPVLDRERLLLCGEML